MLTLMPAAYMWCAHTTKPIRRDRDHGVGHAEIAEHRLVRERRHDVADDAEARHDENVDLRVAEEPEQMLVEDRIAAAGGAIERRAEVAVRQQHGDGAGENRQRQQQQERRDEHGPDEQRHLVHGHARRAHVEDGGDEVDGAEDRRRAGDVQRQDGEVHRRTGVAGRRQRRIGRPAAADAVHARAALDEHRDEQQRTAATGSSQNEMLFMRGNAMSGAPIMSGIEPVAEAAHGRGHDHEEHHDQAVAGDEHVEACAGWQKICRPGSCELDDACRSKGRRR